MKSSLTSPFIKTVATLATASLFLVSSLHADCTYQLFTISSSKGTKISEFIDQLSDECSFSVIVSDPEAEKALDSSLNKTKLKNLTIDEVLSLILTENNLNYSLENNVLKISYIQTKTYNIDYIISERRGLGSTDVVLSSQSGSSSSTASTDTSLNSSGQSETGIKIESTDEVKFWEELDNELRQVLNRPEDIYEAQEPIINKNSGMITVSATVKQLNRLEKYLEELQKKVQYQVLIDVNLLSVNISDGSSTGIDWSQIYALQNFQVSADIQKWHNVDTFTEGEITTGLYPLGGDNFNASGQLLQLKAGASINELVKFLRTQGDVKSVSNPKVLTLNNQPALITVGTEYFYQIKETGTSQANGGLTQQLENVSINSVFAGVLLDITPEIAHDGTITLKINPSLTQTRQTLAADNSERTMPPDLDRRQMASVVTVKDGEQIILGGLINTHNNIESNKVPLLGDIPLLGYLFKYEERTKSVEELVVVIKPTIIQKENNTLSLSDLGYSDMDLNLVPANKSKEADEQ
jgi:general secretion pathway protein D